MRTRNSNARGGSWTAAEIAAVWRKGQVVPGYDPAVWRKDRCGWWMKHGEFGQRTEYGWEVDHIRPVSKGGSDDPTNLQPLHWRNNVSKSDNWPDWSCAA